MLTIGVDIGGTKIAAGLVTPEGELIRKTKARTPATPSEIVTAVIAVVNELSHDQDIAAVGVAAAGFVGADRATVRFAPNVAWREEPLRERLRGGIDAPVVIENDANAAGWAEYRFGVGRNTHDMVMLTVGTGLGGALILGGQLVRGAFGVAAELGHMRVVPSGAPCGCGREGCWEQYASGSALVRWGNEVLMTRPDAERSALAAAARDGGGELTGPMITSVAQRGDLLAIELLETLGRWLGEGMSAIASLIDPEVFVIGGGVSAAGELLRAPAEEGFLSELSGRGHRPEARVVLASFSNDAGIVGAADLARR